MLLNVTSELEYENEFTDNCCFTMKLNYENIRIVPIGWFLICESQFIEIYADSTYIKTYRGRKIVSDISEHEHYER